MSFNFAIIGCGRISPNHVSAALENKMNITALCDIDKEQIKKIKSMFNLGNEVKEYISYQEMIENEKLDLIAIATESGKHGSIAIDCINKGINLIIEKPITLSLSEADEIIRISKEKNVKVSTSHQNRFNKAILKIRESIESNRFGRLLHGTAHIRWNRGESYYTQANWRGTWEQDGGALMNQCIHNIDILKWMMGGKVKEVMAMTDNLNHDYIDAEDLGLAILKFENGSYGLVEGTTNVFPTNLEETLYLFGDKGTVKAGGKSVNIIEEWIFNDNLDDADQIKEEYKENPPTVYGFGHIPLYKDVKESIINDKEPYVTAQDGRDALELILAIYLSSKTGEKVILPLKNISTIDFIGMF